MGAKDLSKGRPGHVAAHRSSAVPRNVARPSQDSNLREAEREVAAHVAVAEALAAWERGANGFGAVLSGLAEALGYEVGVLWVPRGDRLRPRSFWQEGEGDLGEFKVMTLTSRLPRGSELPGRAWQQLIPSGQGSADGFGAPRWRAALAAGFQVAIAFPAMRAEEALAVIELGSREEPQLTERLKRSLAAIGYVLGEFFAHRRGVLDEQMITDRQVEILKLAARGLSSRQIAEDLQVSPSTIKTHFENSYARLGVNNRAAAVAEAVRLGLVE
jgi:DNA-binding CsgD family transcriptional regulator